MLRKYVYILFTFLFVAPEAFTEELKTIEFGSSLEGVSEVHIIGYRGDIQLVEKSQNQAAKLTFKGERTDWSVMREQKGSLLILRVDQPLKLSKDMSKTIDNLSPIYVSTSVNLPIKISWHTGTISAKNWNQKTEIRLISGVVSLFGGDSEKDVFVSKGQILAQSIKGELRAESYNGKIQVQKASANLKLKSFSGAIGVQKSEGRLSVSSYSGKVSVDDNKGKLSFELQKAQLRVRKFAGRIDGQGGNSNLRIAYDGKADVNISSDAGKVIIDNPKESGAFVNVGSQAGGLYLPRGIRRFRASSLKKGSGRLKGKLPGRVFVRTKTGGIFLR